MNKKLLGFVFGALLATAIYWFFVGSSGQSTPQAAAQQQAMELGAVRLRAQTITTYEELPGRTNASKIAEIRPQVSGIVTERSFQEGGEVTEGQQLYQIDPAPFKAAYDSARADVQKAEATVKSIKARNGRYEELVKIDAVSRQEYEDVKAEFAQAEADVAIAKAAMAQAKINLDYTKVYAPIDGRIGKSRVTKGALVTASQPEPLATVTALDPIYVDVTQSSADLMRLRSQVDNYENIPIRLFVGEDETPYAHEGSLQFHEVTVDETTGSVLLRALFPNPENQLLPGLFVRTKLTLSQPDALVVPQRAATRQPNGSLAAWRLDKEGKAEQVTFTVSGASEGNWIIASGLNEGDVVITEGTIKVSAGAPIKPVFAEPEETAKTTPPSVPMPETAEELE